MLKQCLNRKRGYMMENLTPTLEKWFIDKIDGYLVAHGIVINHPKIPNYTRIHTSPIIYIETQIDSNRIIITTRHTVYDCQLSQCRFEKQDQYLNIIEDYSGIKEKYQYKSSTNP